MSMTRKKLFTHKISLMKKLDLMYHTLQLFLMMKAELTVPLETILKLAVRVDCDLIETKEVKNDEKLGYVEQKELKGDGYDMTTGDFVTKQKK